MSRNTMFAFVALMLVLLVGLGGGYWVVKKYKAKQNREYRFQGQLTLNKEGVDPEAFKKMMLSDEIMGKVVERHDLLSRWQMGSVDEAKNRLNQKFRIEINGKEVMISYQDKDEVLAETILQSILKMAREQHQARQGISP